MIEEWKVWKITKYAKGTVWEVSNYGRVKRNGEIVNLPKLEKGYIQISGGYLHRIVAQLFIPNPENKPQVDHIDTDRNNNRVDNLRWVTQSENNLNPITRQRYINAAKRESEIRSNRMKGENNPMYGKYNNHFLGHNHTEESKHLQSIHNAKVNLGLHWRIDKTTKKRVLI